jgi:hypothetical protein
MMEDLKHQTLEWLYRELKRGKIALANAEKRYEPTCVYCKELQNIRRNLAIVDHLIDMVLRED